MEEPVICDVMSDPTPEVKALTSCVTRHQVKATDGQLLSLKSSESEHVELSRYLVKHIVISDSLPSSNINDEPRVQHAV